MRFPVFSETVGLRATAVYDAMRNGLFSRPVLIGDRAVAWRASALSEWIVARSGLAPESAVGDRQAGQQRGSTTAAAAFRSAPVNPNEMPRK